ncbi:MULTISPECIES: hypothetical protein [unclassified Streptococcus]|uniref:hypothetical protein n=1 Tax=unclassified Streptococcus TaxID=2608887 RepID=UPI0018A8CD82|nr:MULTISPECIES: hypothetical protein [unclassified Streptococcus]MBF8969806.1 hypothetical protein [Streptococcus sp. NLN76]MBG9366695.1 hypothetical protein [Streptococcus sp. NLN64]MBJ6745179.1 hypothetical protein [Streptococcus sp. 121]
MIEFEVIKNSNSVEISEEGLLRVAGGVGRISGGVIDLGIRFGSGLVFGLFNH